VLLTCDATALQPIPTSVTSPHTDHAPS